MIIVLILRKSILNFCQSILAFPCTNRDGENRLFVCPLWLAGLLTILLSENIKRRLQVLGARSTREQGHLPLTRRQMRRPEAGLHQQTR